MSERKIVAYRLEPVFEIEPGGIATAAVMQCMATGEYLSGMGGGGDYLAPGVVEMLRGGDCVIIKGASTPIEAERERDALLEAITPSAGTKAAYMGQFQFQFGNSTPNVPWTTIKAIMEAIGARAKEQLA